MNKFMPIHWIAYISGIQRNFYNYLHHIHSHRDITKLILGSVELQCNVHCVIIALPGYSPTVW